MPSAFYDTNVILYAARPWLEPKDEYKRPVALALMESDDFGISTQVLAEFYHNAAEKGEERLTTEQADIWLDDLCARPCAHLDTDLMRLGVLISRRYRISYWDGAIIAAAHELGATTLYSEDLNDGQHYGDVTVVNPFLPASH